MIGLPWHRHEAGPALLDKIRTSAISVARKGSIPTRNRASWRGACDRCGTTHIRTFVDIDTDWKLAGFEGVSRTREDFKDSLDIQIVAFPQSGMRVRPGTVELMAEALQNGAEVVGGLDPSTIDRDPARHLDVIFDLAVKHDADVDVHLSRTGRAGRFFSRVDRRANEGAWIPGTRRHQPRALPGRRR